MAGKTKKRIDYAGWSVDIFSNDNKIDKLLDAQDWTGFGVYFFLCQMAFGGEGYYYEWDYDLCATVARKMGGSINAGKVKETVNYCLRIGLFNKPLFEKWKILTSRGIQNSYLAVLKSKNRKGTEIYKEYWLLDTSKSEDYQGVVFISKNGQTLGVNDDSLGENGQTLGVNEDSLGQKESKVRESKEDKKITCVRMIEEFISAYPRKCNHHLTELEYCKLIRDGTETEENLVACARNYADACRILKVQERFIKKAENFLRDFAFEEFLPDKYQKPKADKKSGFNDFKQNAYDFDELEKELISN